MFLATRIRKHEFGLLFRRGDFVRVLEPGDYRLWGRLLASLEVRVEIVDVNDLAFAHPHLDVLLEDEAFQAKVRVVEITESERGVVFVDGVVVQALTPGRYVFLRNRRHWEVVVFECTGDVVEHPRLDAIVGSKAASLFDVRQVPAQRIGLLYRNGAFLRRLGSGRQVLIRDGSHYELVIVDLRERQLEVSGQEIMTADKVSLRMNLQLAYRVVDLDRSLEAASDLADALYRSAQLALREAVGTRRLDELLASKERLGAEILETLAPRAAAYGLEVTSAGLRDLILPGEMKELLNRVVEAEKEAEANLIRRREETAATRSQLNTARLLAENPVLMRLKELDELRKILLAAKATFVFGEGDMLARLRGLVGEAES
ncbi:MAG: slipin family protein [Planctomycetota bacterium]